MAKQRVTETDQGIQGEFTVEIYDQMQRRFRDKGWIETKFNNYEVTINPMGIKATGIK
jgi:hypothetical protein